MRHGVAATLNAVIGIYHRFAGKNGRSLRFDDKTFYGRIVFMVNKLNQKIRLTRATILRMVREEQEANHSNKFMSLMLWDMFTGSSPYLSIFLIGINPVFLFRFIKSLFLETVLIFRKN